MRRVTHLERLANTEVVQEIIVQQRRLQQLREGYSNPERAAAIQRGLQQPKEGCSNPEKAAAAQKGSQQSRGGASVTQRGP